MTPLLSDARLARQASDGSQDAFAAIYERYHQDIYRFCLSILGRPEDAQEALQNTMVKALRALPGEQREIQLKPWLYRVAHNESIDLLRRRREGPELDSAQVSAGAEIPETVALRERLSRLLADLGELPTRQRGALVMRELAGLDYEQIGAALETSAAAARQAVYEARLNLHELETGRAMSCDQVTRQLSEADGRVTRRRDIQAHLRACSDCRAFRDSIASRRQDLAALAPLPAAAATSIMHGLVGGKIAAGGGLGSAGGGLGGAAASTGAGVGKVAGTSVVVKAVATVAVVATVGVTAADRSGLVDAGLPGGGKSESASRAGASGAEGGSAKLSREPNAVRSLSPKAQTGIDEASAAGLGEARDQGPAAPHDASSSPPLTTPNEEGPASSGKPTGTSPAASRHGQETSAAHKSGGARDPDDHPGKSQGKSQSGSHGNQGKHSEASRHPGTTKQPKDGSSKGKGQTTHPTAGKPGKTHPQPAEPAGNAHGGAAAEKPGANHGKAESDETEASP